MEGFPRINRTMSAGPGPPKSPAPHPPRRGQSVTAGRLTRYRSVREHKSVLDFGRNWRDWEVDIFQDDETVSNATTETGTATSIALGLGIGIAVDEEEGATGGVDDGQATVSSPHPHDQYGQQQQQQQTPASSLRRRRTAPLLSTPVPQTPSGAPQLTMQWQWPDLMAGTGISDASSPFDFENSPYWCWRWCGWRWKKNGGPSPSRIPRAVQLPQSTATNQDGPQGGSRRQLEPLAWKLVSSFFFFLAAFSVSKVPYHDDYGCQVLSSCRRWSCQWCSYWCNDRRMRPLWPQTPKRTGFPILPSAILFRVHVPSPRGSRGFLHSGRPFVRLGPLSAGPVCRIGVITTSISVSC
ncbi:hypothetical protein CaCOL14_005203 [Colletotrichum acutatum]